MRIQNMVSKWPGPSCIFSTWSNFSFTLGQNIVWFLFWHERYSWRSENLQIKIYVLCTESNITRIMQINNATVHDF